MRNRSFDKIMPSNIMIKAVSLIASGIVRIWVVCRVDSLDKLPAKIAIRASRVRGRMVFLFSLWWFGLIRWGPVMVNRMICML